MTKKQQDLFLAALLNRGETEVKRLTSCIVVSRKDGGYYYLGTSGSVRIGHHRAGSIPVSTKFKKALLENEIIKITA